MALFKFRWLGQKEASEHSTVRHSRTTQAESVDDMRRRARHRLIGAAVLVVLGVIGFPLLFDTQPRPIPVDVSIEMPDRDQVAPLIVPGAQTQTDAPAAMAQGAKRHDALDDGEELVVNEPAPLSMPKPPQPPRLVPVPEPVAKPAPAPKPEPKPEVKPAPQPEPKPVPAPPPAPSEAERARALLEGRSPAAQAPKTEANKPGRFIVQVGAFADAAKASEVRARLELAGLKTYTQVVDTKDGKRTRVRVGPFDQRTDADKAAAHIKGLGLPASVLTL